MYACPSKDQTHWTLMMDLLDMTNEEEIVREFWRLMATNDFASVKAVLASDFVLEWPQSNERIWGSENFVRMNSEYPAAGPWRFSIRRLIVSPGEVVTHVEVTDGERYDEAITFFRIEDGRIGGIVEYWPESFEPPEHRKHLTEPIN